MRFLIISIIIFLGNNILCQEIINTKIINFNDIEYFTIFKETLFNSGENGVLFNDSIPVNGQLILYSTDKTNKRYYKPEYIFKTGYYKNNKKDGVFHSYNYVLNKKRKNFYTNRESVRSYRKGELDGVFTNGSFIGNYKKGILDGIYMDQWLYGSIIISNYRYDTLFQDITYNIFNSEITYTNIIEDSNHKVNRNGILISQYNDDKLIIENYNNDFLYQEVVLTNLDSIISEYNDSIVVIDPMKISIEYFANYDKETETQTFNFMKNIHEIDSIVYINNQLDIQVVKYTNGVITQDVYYTSKNNKIIANKKNDGLMTYSDFYNFVKNNIVLFDFVKYEYDDSGRLIRISKKINNNLQIDNN